MRAVLALAAALVASGPSAWAQQSLRISGTDCSRLVEHRAQADVAYQPGVDAKGRPVAPADLPGGIKVEAPTEFTIDLVVDLQRRFGIPANPNLFRPDAHVGQVTIKGDKAYFNGRALTDKTQDALAILCKERLAARR